MTTAKPPKPPPKPPKVDLTHRVAQLEHDLQRLQANVQRLGEADVSLVARRIEPLEAAVRTNHTDINTLTKRLDSIIIPDAEARLAALEKQVADLRELIGVVDMDLLKALIDFLRAVIQWFRHHKPLDPIGSIDFKVT